MNTEHIEKLAALFEACQELRGRLNEAREGMTDDEFDALYDGHAGDILSAAMDVEALLEECEES